MIFPHQQRAYEILRSTARAFFSDEWKSFTLVRPRFNRLLIGPSGTGKTHLVRALATELQLPMLELSFLNWIPIGAVERGARPTWLDLGEFCCRHERGIIFLDEIDKCAERSSWITHLRVEAFCLLDRFVPGNLKWDDIDLGDDDVRANGVRVLAEGMLILAGGAFQDLWTEQARPTAGFHSSSSSPDIDHRTLGNVIPVEIANRFVSPPVILHPLRREDYEEMVTAICRDLPTQLAQTVRRRAQETLTAAINAGLGCRWIEQLLLEAMTEGSARFPQRSRSLRSPKCTP